MNLLDFHAGIEHPFFLIAGPCVVESESLAMESAIYLKKVCSELEINFIYKSSYDKAISLRDFISSSVKQEAINKIQSAPIALDS